MSSSSLIRHSATLLSRIGLNGKPIRGASLSSFAPSSILLSSSSSSSTNKKYLNNQFASTTISSSLATTYSSGFPAMTKRSFGSNTEHPGAASTNLQFTTLTELQEEACKLYEDRLALGTRNGSKFDYITYKELGAQIAQCRAVLQKHNIGMNDKVALISNNRVEWAVTYYAVVSLGAQIVPMYEAQLEKEWKYITVDSDAKLLMVANEKIREQVKDYPGKVGKVESILCFDCEADYIYSYAKWMKEAAKGPLVPSSTFSENNIATIIYTSGTTGNPKGVELSHKNIVANLQGLKAIWKSQLDYHQSLAFLPWAHVFGQTAELHSLIATGSALAICPKREELLECISLVKPTIILSVPILFNKVYDGVQKKMAGKPSAVQFLYKNAMKYARAVNSAKEHGRTPGFIDSMMYNLLDKIVFKAIREAMGGRLRFMASGGAATGITVLNFFEDIGIPICEGYGLTETAPVITAGANNWETRRLGCVGVSLPNVIVRVIDPSSLEEVPMGSEGEITCAGDSVMVGYRNNQKANEEVFYVNPKDGKRYFRTGDLGSMVDGKFLKITGRIKEQFKLENGKYVVPAVLEDLLGRSQFIAQALLYGDNKPFTISLIVPNQIELKAWCATKKIPFDDSNPAVAYNHPEVVALLTNEVKHVSLLMKSFERPTKFACLALPFTQDNQMLTPKMSLRRNNILKEYNGLIAEVYANTAGHFVQK